MMTSVLAATSAGDPAPSAPARISGAIASWRRANTVTLCPPFNRFRAIGAPIAPSPITPTCAISSLCSLFALRCSLFDSSFSFFVFRSQLPPLAPAPPLPLPRGIPSRRRRSCSPASAGWCARRQRRRGRTVARGSTATTAGTAVSKNAYPPRDHGSCSQLTDDHAISSLFFKLSQDSSRAMREGPSASSIARVAALAPPPASSVRMRSALLLVSVPNRADRKRGSESSRRAPPAPWCAIELQRGFRRGSIPDCCHCLPLNLGKIRLELNVAQRRRRQRADEVIEPRLVYAPIRFERGRDAVSRLSHASKDRPQLERGIPAPLRELQEDDRCRR